MRIFLLLFVALFFGIGPIYSQTGLTAGPPRLYFIAGPGQQQIQYIDVTNPSKDYALELGVTFEDWKYTEIGDNELSPKGSLLTSCASWISIDEPYFALAPGESKRIQVNMAVPQDLSKTDEIPVHTCMLFITQLNPRSRAEKDGATIRLAVRSGIKVYHRLNIKEKQDVEINNLSYLTIDSLGDFLEADYNVLSNTWMEGKVRTEIINQENGKKINLEDISFFALPNDERKQYIKLPTDLVTGKYLASVIFLFNNQESVKIGELEFNHVGKK